MPPDVSVPVGAVAIPIRSRDGSIRAHVLVDAADADWANQWRWSLTDLGYAYRVQKVDGAQRNIRMHRALLGCETGDGVEVDHIDGNRLNNQRANLREATRLQNAQNLAPLGRTSRFRGVYYNRNLSRWHARVRVNGHTHHLGYFAREDEAAEAARLARRRLMPYAVEARSEAPV